MRVAVLHQAIEPPLINGVRKPMKPGGYQDSGADIAYNLSKFCEIPIATPLPEVILDPRKHEGWTFPDFEESLVSAVEKHGASHFWPNTIVFEQHPLQTSAILSKYANDLKVVGQAMKHVQLYDDKDYVNSLLRKVGTFTMPKSFVAPNSIDIQFQLRKHDLTLPVVAKPIRGRGSQGVKVCKAIPDLASHIDSLGPNNAMLEEFLPGTEATITVMPPSKQIPEYWALPVVVRFNHQDGIAPYNGVVAVTSNSSVVPEHEAAKDPAYAQVQRECEAVARLLQVKAPIRIDVRKAEEKVGAPFCLFDVNMKPNMTAPGRPGREDQASLTLLAAEGLGWKGPDLIRRILETANTLKELREAELPHV
ncbi:uncharacterized protein MYCFIDRAFT_205540 [Pseudocercospora fijiensis CIRAD86]|uniref:ATP-grasp domain-containing protein n=1 Tax=Pseudocercospora fijiensis (strain CIRAD86) TaxID=383855 RepID=M2YGE8_PSEFD|nr:uncharacterized protein MYCFIDRAFT_205540 [Pseudocercospora fijiensis CIRAD86]EME76870.1 hypothetical protein MYCFIDRAFT_205540 [Pseudocercospora fijiensis CIRAD86]